MPMGAEYDAVTISIPKTGQEDSSAGVGGASMKISRNILHVAKKKSKKNFFQQMLFFVKNGRNFEHFGNFLPSKFANFSK